MNTRKLKDSLNTELNSVNLTMSKELMDTPIQAKRQSTEIYNNTKIQKTFSSKLFLSLSCLCSILIIIASIFLIFIQKQTTSASSLTSYIIEINPSVCVVSDNENMVVSAFSLNYDGDKVLSNEEFSSLRSMNVENFISKYIEISKEEGYMSGGDENRSIKIIATNNKAKKASKNCSGIEKILNNKLKELGFENNFQIIKEIMDINDFKDKIGLDNNFKNLDEMRDELVNHKKFFDPSFVPQI